MAKTKKAASEIGFSSNESKAYVQQIHINAEQIQHVTKSKQAKMQQWIQKIWFFVKEQKQWLFIPKNPFFRTIPSNDQILFKAETRMEHGNSGIGKRTKSDGYSNESFSTYKTVPLKGLNMNHKIL